MQICRFYNFSNILDRKIYYYFSMFLRFCHIGYIFLSEIIKHNFSNFIYKFFTKLPTLKRLYLIKNITNRLENINIVYLKIFQSIALDKNLLMDDEKDYLLKYTDNVPFTAADLDYDVLEMLEKDFNIVLQENEPLNSGIVSIVYKGIYGNSTNKIVIKVLKKNIHTRIIDAFNDIESIIGFANIIPYIKNMNFDKILRDNKELLLNQTDFNQEAKNINIFREKNKNLPEYRIPEVYLDITQKYPNVLVMENIKGLTFKDIEFKDPDIRDEFGKILMKFGYISILYNSAIHCDMHPGNIFFYINSDDENNSGLPKYQLGIIDFGICSFPDKNNQNAYYIFFNDINYNKDFRKIDTVLSVLIEEKDRYDNFDIEEKNSLKNECIECVKKYLDTNFDIYYLIEISSIFNSYGLTFSKEFNHLCLSLQVSNNLALNLCKNVTQTEYRVMEELNRVNNLIQIE